MKMWSRAQLFQQANGQSAGGAGSSPSTGTAQPAANSNANLQTSEAGLQAIVGHEREERRYYNDPVNNCTWGTGFLAHLGPCTDEELQRPVTAQMVQDEYRRQVSTTEQAVRRQIGNAAVTQEQFDALVSYTYNMGPTGAANVLAAVRDGRNADAAASMLAHTTAVQRDSQGRVVRDTNGQPVRERLRGLVVRRQREAAPFLPNSQQNPANRTTQTSTATGSTNR